MTIGTILPSKVHTYQIPTMAGYKQDDVTPVVHIMSISYQYHLSFAPYVKYYIMYVYVIVCLCMAYRLIKI